MANPKLDELELATLRIDLPRHGLVAGDVGTVVLVHGDHEANEVEFVAADGRTIAVETSDADQVARLEGKRILHACELTEEQDGRSRSCRTWGRTNSTAPGRTPAARGPYVCGSVRPFRRCRSGAVCLAPLLILCSRQISGRPTVWAAWRPGPVG
jgi:hypothetical protein